MKGTVTSYETAAGTRYRWAWTEYLVDGTKHQHSGKGFRRKKDADEALRKSLAQYDGGRRTSPDVTLTLATWLEHYAASRVGRLSIGGREADRCCINRIVPVLGTALVLRKMEHPDVDYLMQKLREPGADKRSTKVKKPLSEASISRTIVFLSGALKEAVRKGKMSHNPCDIVTKPKVPKHLVGAWSPEELKGFLAQREESGDRLLPLWRFAPYTGYRLSEALGLRWPSLNLDKGYVKMVEKGLQNGNEMEYSAGGKSESAVRTIDLDPETIAVLRAWKEEQALEDLAAGRVPSGLVFTDENGAGLKSSIVGNRWRAAVRQTGLRPIPFKDLRSTHGTILADSGAHPKVISARLGHSDEAFSLKRYVSRTPGMQAEAARIFSQAMGEAPAPAESAADIWALLDGVDPEVRAQILTRLAAEVEDGT